MTNDKIEKTVILGLEWDNDLRGKLKEALNGLGAGITDHSWGVVGSQEVETLDVIIGDSELHVEAETYLGLTLSGPPDLVDKVAKLVSDADGDTDQ